MTHYLMAGGETACGGQGAATREKALVGCPACLAKVTRWGGALGAAKAAWAKRVDANGAAK